MWTGCCRSWGSWGVSDVPHMDDKPDSRKMKKKKKYLGIVVLNRVSKRYVLEHSK